MNNLKYKDVREHVIRENNFYIIFKWKHKIISYIKILNFKF